MDWAASLDKGLASWSAPHTSPGEACWVYCRTDSLSNLLHDPRNNPLHCKQWAEWFLLHCTRRSDRFSTETVTYQLLASECMYMLTFTAMKDISSIQFNVYTDVTTWVLLMDFHAVISIKSGLTLCVASPHYTASGGWKWLSWVLALTLHNMDQVPIFKSFKNVQFSDDWFNIIPANLTLAIASSRM